MSFKITGLDKLQRELRDAQRALNELDGTIGTISFSPGDPGSVQGAIRQMEQMIDRKVFAYRSNPLVSTVVAGMKEQYRKALLERARNGGR